MAILLAESDDAARDYIATLLERAGQRVVQAASPEAACALLRDHPDIELLLADALGFGVSGSVRLAERARALRPGLRMLFVEGLARGASEAARAGPPSGTSMDLELAEQLLTSIETLLGAR
jgi:CheY-like chemotaxis protein